MWKTTYKSCFLENQQFSIIGLLIDEKVLKCTVESDRLINFLKINYFYEQK